MIKFRCANCDKKIGVPEKYAGKLVKCPRCGEPARVPEPEIQSDPVPDIWSDDMISSETDESSPLSDYLDGAQSPARVEQARCSKCGNAAPVDSEFCVNCGQQIHTAPAATFVSSGSQKSSAVQTVIAAAKSSSKLPIAIVCSFVGAVLGGLIWVGVSFIGFESGYIACIVGVLAGFGARLFYDQQDIKLGIIAIIMSLVGLFMGKAFIVQWIINPELSEFETAELTALEIEFIIQDFDQMCFYGCEWLVMNGEFTQELADEVAESIDSGSTLLLSDEAKAGLGRVKSLVANWTVEQKRENVSKIFSGYQQKVIDLSFFDRVIETLTPWDILWALLALSSAFGLGTGYSAHD